MFELVLSICAIIATLGIFGWSICKIPDPTIREVVMFGGMSIIAIGAIVVVFGGLGLLLA